MSLDNNFLNSNSEGDNRERLNKFAEKANAIKMKTFGVCCEDYYNTATFRFAFASGGDQTTLTSNDANGQTGTIKYWTWTIYDNEGSHVTAQIDTGNPANPVIVDTSSLEVEEKWTINFKACRTTTDNRTEEISYTLDVYSGTISSNGSGSSNP